jgi:glucose/arabinose dehydrogenase
MNSQAGRPRSHRVFAGIESLEGRSLFSVSLTGSGTDAAVDVAQVQAATATTTQLPRVTICNPANGATGVDVSTCVAADLSLPNGGVNAATVTSTNVYLKRVSDGVKIAAAVNTSGAGDALVLTPKSPLAANTKYAFVVTSGVKDLSGAGFQPTQITFTTQTTIATRSTAVKFDKVALPTTQGKQFFGITMGPDGRLYAGTSDGLIERFNVNADGTLGTAQVIDSIKRANGAARFVVGLAFDPASTASAPVLWVSHTATSSIELGGTPGADWTGKISRLSGPNLGTYQDAVVHLPRSVRDHVTDQLAFGPDGALYFCQPSNSAMGAADPTWGSRPERLLSAAILRLDTSKVTAAPLDAKTPDGGGSYNPFAAGAPLTIYAQGVRNTFDLVWHSNGSLYAPGNGSAAGGYTPAGGGAPALTKVSTPETDFLFRINKSAYYGHPNPLLNHYVLNGGNPTSGTDKFEVPQYPVGTKPDAKWQPAVFDFGAHRSPDGAIEYKGNAFGGALNHKLLVVRYSGGDDIVALNVGSGTTPITQTTGLPGMTGFNNPVDLTEDPKTGNLYVAELGSLRITLLRVHDTTAATASATAAAATFSDTTIDPAVPAPVDESAEQSQATVSDPTPLVIPATGAADTQAQPPVRTRRDEKLIRRINKIVTRTGLSVPDLTNASSADLQQAYENLVNQEKCQKLIAKITRVATRRGVTLPDMSSDSVADLKQLLKSVVKAKAA